MGLKLSEEVKGLDTAGGSSSQPDTSVPTAVQPTPIAEETVAAQPQVPVTEGATEEEEEKEDEELVDYEHSPQPGPGNDDEGDDDPTSGGMTGGAGTESTASQAEAAVAEPEQQTEVPPKDTSGSGAEKITEALEEGEFVPDRGTLARWMKMSEESLVFDFEKDIQEGVNLDDYIIPDTVPELADYDRVIFEDWSSDDTDEDVGDGDIIYGGKDQAFASFGEELDTEIQSQTLTAQALPPSTESSEKSKLFRNVQEPPKYERSLKFYTVDKKISLGAPVAIHYLPDVKKIALRRMYGVQYFPRLTYLKYLPWYDVVHILKMKLHNEHKHPLVSYAWAYLKKEMRSGFKNWSPYRPVIVTNPSEIDPNTGEPVKTLRYKKPRCLKVMPLPEMRQHWGEFFSCWYYDEKSGEAVIVLNEGGKNTEVRVLDPMWLINLSELDIAVLCSNKIEMEDRNVDQCLQYQRVIEVCYLNGIHNGAVWDSRWFELQERIEAENAEWKAKIEERRRIAARSRFLYAPSRTYQPPSEPAPIVKSRSKVTKRKSEKQKKP